MSSVLPYNENELLLSFNGGDEKAMRVLFDEHHLALIQFARSITHNTAQSEDAVTDAFIQLWKKRASFHATAAIRSFLYLTTKNACLNWLEHQAVVQRSETDLVQLQPDNDLENHLLQAELIQFLYQEIFRLPEQHRELIQLLFIDGLSHPEAAGMLGITEANLRMRKSRAIEQLRHRLIEKGLFIFFLKFAVAKSSLACLYK